MFSDGFTDLRMNHQNGQGDDSFWPSFTDIMTVIVMIFLLAMVVVMIRNSELIDRLKATMEAEREAAELVRKTATEKEGLAIKLIEAEQLLSMLRLEHMKVTEQRDLGRKTVAERDAELRQLKSEFATTQAALDTTRSELTQTSQQLTQTETRLTQTMQQRDLLAEQLEDNQTKFAALQREHQEQGTQLHAMKLSSEESSSKLAVLGGEYDELKEKYDKLVRPARTARGKTIVEVRKTKSAGKEEIAIKLPGKKAFKVVTEARMHKELTTLQKKFSKSLYVKIIFPENSGLSYNEAWGFTNKLHKKYDYYFQEK